MSLFFDMLGPYFSRLALQANEIVRLQAHCLQNCYFNIFMSIENFFSYFFYIFHFSVSK